MGHLFNFAMILFLSTQVALATGMPDGWGAGVHTTDDPFASCPGAGTLAIYNDKGEGLFLNDIGRGKVKKVPKGISYKKLDPLQEGQIREFYEVKMPSWPTGRYIFTKDTKGNVLSVELSSNKSDRDLKNEAEFLLTDALKNGASNIKVPTHQRMDFDHTAEGCKLASSSIGFKVFPVEDGKVAKSDLYSLEEEEYTERFCDKFNELKNKKPDLMKKIHECSFSGSSLLTETKGLLENIREHAGYDKAPPWTPNTFFKHDAISNVRLGLKSIKDTVALSEFPTPESILNSMNYLKTLCDEKLSMYHAQNVNVSEKIKKKSQQSNTDTTTNSISK